MLQHFPWLAWAGAYGSLVMHTIATTRWARRCWQRMKNWAFQTLRSLLLVVMTDGRRDGTDGGGRDTPAALSPRAPRTATTRAARADDRRERANGRICSCAGLGATRITGYVAMAAPRVARYRCWFELVVTTFCLLYYSLLLMQPRTTHRLPPTHSLPLPSALPCCCYRFLRLFLPPPAICLPSPPRAFPRALRLPTPPLPVLPHLPQLPAPHRHYSPHHQQRRHGSRALQNILRFDRTLCITRRCGQNSNVALVVLDTSAQPVAFHT